MYNLDAEKAVLGAILVRPSILFDVQEIIVPDDFYYGKHRYIYDAIVGLIERRVSVDNVTLSDELKRRNQLDEIGGLEYINRLFIGVPKEHHGTHYAEIVARCGFLRRLSLAANEIAQLASDDDTPIDEKRNKAEQIIIDACHKLERNDLTPLRVILSQVYDEIERKSKEDIPIGVHTSFQDLDKITGGWQKSDLIYIGGRPGMGKTSFMLDCARHAVFQYNRNVAVFSLEMSAEQLCHRLLSVQSGISSHKIRLGSLTDSEWPMLVQAFGSLSSGNMFIDDTAAVSVMQIRRKMRRLLMQHDIDLIMIDYLQLMQTDRRFNNTVSEYTDVSKNLKALAREFDVPIVVGAQLSRAVEQRGDKRPVLSDLRESGGLEQDADIVAFLYRDDYYNNDAIPGITELLIRKHRNGPTGIVNLLFDKEHTTFRSVSLFQEDLNDDRGHNRTGRGKMAS